MNVYIVVAETLGEDGTDLASFCDFGMFQTVSGHLHRRGKRRRKSLQDSAVPRCLSGKGRSLFAYSSDNKLAFLDSPDLYML